MQRYYHEGRQRKGEWGHQDTFHVHRSKGRVTPLGLFPLTRFDHVRILHKPTFISGKCFTTNEVSPFLARSALRARQLPLPFSHHYSTVPLPRLVTDGARKPRFDRLPRVDRYQDISVPLL